MLLRRGREGSEDPATRLEVHARCVAEVRASESHLGQLQTGSRALSESVWVGVEQLTGGQALAQCNKIEGFSSLASRPSLRLYPDGIWAISSSEMGENQLKSKWFGLAKGLAILVPTLFEATF